MKATSIRLDETKVKELEKMAYALSLIGHKGENRNKVSVSDVIRKALEKFKTDDKTISDLINKANIGGVQ